MGAAASATADPIGEALRTDPSATRNNFPASHGMTATLADRRDARGRTVGYAEYGAPAAMARHVMLFFHGTPGTRFFFSSVHAAHAEAHGVRVIVPERPGYGLSTPVPDRTIRDGAADAAALLDLLPVRVRVHVLGYSAGGPFALAFAHDFPARCASVAVVSSLSPNARGVTTGMTMQSKLGYGLAMRAPAMLRGMVRMLVPSARREVYLPERGEFTAEENAFFRGREDVRRVFLQSTLELYSRKTGAAAEVLDYTLMARPWQFDLAQVRGNFPVWVYGSENDNKCTTRMFETLVQMLSGTNVNPVVIPRGHHLSFYTLFDGRLFGDIGITS